MKFFADLIYAFLKLLVNIVYKVFYSKVTVINKEHFNVKNPAILISNHPSTLMDPLSVGVKLPHRLSFLANAGLFKNAAFGAFLKIYCIPIERPKDVDGRRINNADNFARADQHLADNGLIYIAAEGTSVVERRLRKLKTGAARIGLSAESKKNFKLGVTIIPVGISYTTPLNFRGEVLVNIGTPVKMSAYQTAHEEHPYKAAKKLTADLQLIMQDLIYHTDDDKHDQSLSQVQTIRQSNTPLSPKEHFIRSKKDLDQIHKLNDTSFEQFKNLGDEYFDTLRKVNIQDLSFTRTIKNRSSIWEAVKLFFGLPLFLYGWINNIFAFSIPWFLSRKLNIFHGYRPAVMALAGLIFIPIFFYIQTKIVSHFVNIPYVGWFYFLTLLPMGWIAWEYRKTALQFLHDQKANKLKKNSPSVFEDLNTKRSNFSSAIESLL